MLRDSEAVRVSDKDLVLPPMGTSGTTETFFVVASTDLQSSRNHDFGYASN